MKIQLNPEGCVIEPACHACGLRFRVTFTANANPEMYGFEPPPGYSHMVTPCPDCGTFVAICFENPVEEDLSVVEDQ